MSHQERRKITAENLSQPLRIDRFIRDHFPSWGRSAVQSLVNAGDVRVNGRKVWRCSWKIENGDRLEILHIPPEKPLIPNEFMDAWLIAQDADLLVVNKPSGLLSQATRWAQTSNLLDLAISRFGHLALFHRLDRDTSGAILLTRTPTVNRYLDQAFKARTVQKEYIAIVKANNRLATTGVIDIPIGMHPTRRDMMVPWSKKQGTQSHSSKRHRKFKSAVTRYEIIEQRGSRQWVRLWPQTGRTHQLRVHLMYMVAPILGDRLYGPEKIGTERLMLHAHTITLPEQGGFPERTFTAPLPVEFALNLEKR